VSCNQERLVVGKIVGIHGIKGFVKIQSYTENKKDLLNFSKYYINNKKLEKIAFHFEIKNNLICSLPSCNNRNEAKTYINKEIKIDKSSLPKLNTNELYQHSLLGYDVETIKGELFGKIVQFHDFGAGIMIEVSNQNEVFYLPIDPKFINEVDIEKKNVILNLPIDFIISKKS
tara:strand:- start:166 stop:684 length:519 start_codon:yes stop_codon:yes gene_type:complete